MTGPLEKPPFTSLRQIGIGGLVLKGDPQDLKDNESPDLRNITFDSGTVGPRNGTTLFVSAPDGEAGSPTQLLKAKDSNGTTFLIAVFGTNFYLLDKTNKTWTKISPTVLPVQVSLFYGSVSWNLGTGSDAFYFGNGSDIVMKWVPMLTYLGAAAGSGDGQITVQDATLFPIGAISPNMTVVVGGTPLTLVNNATGASIIISTNPSDSQTLTLKINGSTVTLKFVSSIGASAGNVLIGSTITDTMTNLLGIVQNPSVTSGTQVALSPGDQTLISNFTYASLASNSIDITPGASVASLVIAGTSSPAATYTNPNNIITISGTVGVNIANGAAITNQIIPVPTIPRGNRFAMSMAQGGGYRMFVAGVPSLENKLLYSQAYDPTASVGTQELFSGGSGTLTAGFMPIIDGEGGIEDLIDFGQFLGILKSNALVQGYFVIDTTDDTISFNVNPTIYGESIFPVGSHLFPNSAVNIVVENSLYIPTVAQGIYKYTPSSTGSQLSTTITPFSDNVISLFTSLMVSFGIGRVEFYNRQLIYLCSSIPGINNLTLVYDFIWNAWTIWDNLNAVDIKEYGGLFYFLCNDDGGLYYFDNTSFQDFRSNQPVPYTTYLYTKRYDFGKPANVKQQSLAMIQGYIMGNTKLYVDVLYNENGSLAAATYLIDGSNTNYCDQIPIYGPGRISLGLNPIGGAQVGTIGAFRVYLDLSFGVGAHVVQFKMYSVDIGSNWGVTGVSVNPDLNEVVPTQKIISIV